MRKIRVLFLDTIQMCFMNVFAFGTITKHSDELASDELILSKGLIPTHAAQNNCLHFSECFSITI